MATHILEIGAELKIQPQHSARDYSYLVVDPGENGPNTNPIKVIMMDPDRKRFFKLADYYHIDQFRELKKTWSTDDILECLENSRADSILSVPDTQMAIRWMHEGGLRPQRRIQASSSLIIDSPRV